MAQEGYLLRRLVDGLAGWSTYEQARKAGDKFEADFDAPLTDIVHRQYWKVQCQQKLEREVGTKGVPDACATTSLYSDCYIGSKKEQGREQKTYQQVSALVAVSGTLSDAGGPKTKEVNPAGIPQACIDYATNGGAQAAGLTTAEPNTTVKAVTESDILAALDNYAKGLAAITDKADSDAYKAAASKLSW